MGAVKQAIIEEDALEEAMFTGSPIYYVDGEPMHDEDMSYSDMSYQARKYRDDEVPF